MTHPDTFSVFTVRARVCGRIGKPVTKRHVSSGQSLVRREARALEDYPPGGAPPRMCVIS